MDVFIVTIFIGPLFIFNTVADKCLYPSPVTVPCKIHDCHPGPNTAVLVILVAPGQTLFSVLDHHLNMHSGIWSEVKLDLVEP